MLYKRRRGETQFPGFGVGDPELIDAFADLRPAPAQQGLSLTDMAERTGITRATISKLETGKIANRTIGTLRRASRSASDRAGLGTLVAGCSLNFAT